MIIGQQAERTSKAYQGARIGQENACPYLTGQTGRASYGSFLRLLLVLVLVLVLDFLNPQRTREKERFPTHSRTNSLTH
jgi:hypothetical protein